MVTTYVSHLDSTGGGFSRRNLSGTLEDIKDEALFSLSSDRS